MELTIQERQLVTDFRQIPPEGQHELMELLTAVKKKYRNSETTEAPQPANQCRLPDQPEKRPEADSDPVFTE